MFLLRQATHRMVIQHHPDIGHLYVPNTTARIPNENGGYFVRTNAAGFRSDTEFRAEKSGKPRILFFGDSVTAGDGCDNDQRFSELVGAALGAEVYNFGLSGSGTDQHLLIYRTFAREIRADLIVLGVYVENIERIKVAARETRDRATGRALLVPKPYFTLGDDPASRALQLHNVPVSKERAPVEDAAEGTYQPQGFGRLKLARKLLDTYRRNTRLAPVRKAVREHLPELRPWMLRLSRFEPYPDYKDEGSRGVGLMDAIVRQFIAECAPTPVLLVPIPTFLHFHDGVAPSYWRHLERLAGLDGRVGVLDLLGPLIDRPLDERRKLVFQRDKHHFSPAGHDLVAKVIGAEIRRKNLIPAPGPAAAPALARPAARTRKRASNPSDSYILGLSCFYHDSAACLVKNGQIVAAAEEERFTRVKNDRRFPHQAANFCLEEGGIHQEDLAAVVYYDNAPLTFERLLHTVTALGDGGKDLWSRTMPSWVRYKLRLPQVIRSALKYDGLLLHQEHHRSHAAAAFYPSPFQDAAILTIDGVGEWATAAIGVGEGREIKLLKELKFPHSLGLLYSAFTQFTGFKVNSGEYKMMGLAPYGEPKYVDLILKNLVDLKDDGSIALNMDYFAYLHEPRMTTAKFGELFGGPARASDGWITQREMDIAKSIQVVTEETMLKMARHAHKLTGKKNLCMSGGVVLNCVANGRIHREGPFEGMWIQPAAGDAGSAVGAALDAYHTYFGKERKPAPDGRSLQKGSYLGPAYSNDEVRAFLDTHGYPYQVLSKDDRAHAVAKLLDEGKVVGHLAGRLEFGPRSLGARSILGDARNREMQVKLNLKIKYRESFRPFAPSVLADKADEYFEFKGESPYMLLVAPVKKSRWLPFDRGAGDNLLEIVKQPRSDIPAITHVDYSARLQTVNREDSPVYYDVIAVFAKRTGYATIVNTSFNVRGEPIVCTPYDAYRCFMRTEMDALVLEHFLLLKEDQPPWPESKGHVEEDDEIAEVGVDRLTKEIIAVFDAGTVAQLGVSSQVARAIADWKRRPSFWDDHKDASTLGEIFDIPKALDRPEATPRERAQAIAKYFGADPTARGRLVDLVATLLEIGGRHTADENLEEEVSESVYVMF